MRIFAQIIIFPFVIFAAVIWLFVGPIFWIPLLGKSVTIFTLAVLTSAITNRSTANSSANLERAILYYFEGFKAILRSMNIDRSEKTAGDENESLIGSIFSNLASVFQMMAFASVFWITMFVFMHHLGILHLQFVADWEKRLFSSLAVSSPSVSTASKLLQPQTPTSDPNRLQAQLDKRLPSELDAFRTRRAELWKPPAGRRDSRARHDGED